MLGAGLGVNALGGGPRTTIGEDPGRRVVLDAGPGQLDPAGVRCLGQQRAQALDVERIGPHHRIGLGRVGHHVPAGLGNYVSHPGRDAGRTNNEARRSHDFEPTRRPASLVRFPMANIKSQIKRNKQNEKRRLRNKAIRSELRTRAKSAVAAAESGADTAADAVREAVKRIDKAAAKGAIHKNQASNRKARLMKRLAKLSS